MTRYLIALSLAVALAGGVYMKGRSDGAARQIARYEAAQRAAEAEADRLSNELRKATMQYLAEKAERETLEATLDAQAGSDPDADRPAFSADSVRRIDAIR